MGLVPSWGKDPEFFDSETPEPFEPFKLCGVSLMSKAKPLSQVLREFYRESARDHGQAVMEDRERERAWKPDRSIERYKTHGRRLMDRIVKEKVSEIKTKPFEVRTKGNEKGKGETK